MSLTANVPILGTFKQWNSCFENTRVILIRAVGNKCRGQRCYFSFGCHYLRNLNQETKTPKCQAHILLRAHTRNTVTACNGLVCVRTQWPIRLLLISSFRNMILIVQYNPNQGYPAVRFTRYPLIHFSEGEKVYGKLSSLSTRYSKLCQCLSLDSSIQNDILSIRHASCLLRK